MAKKPARKPDGRSAYSQALNEAFELFGDLMDPPEWRPGWKGSRGGAKGKKRRSGPFL